MTGLPQSTKKMLGVLLLFAQSLHGPERMQVPPRADAPVRRGAASPEPLDLEAVVDRIITIAESQLGPQEDPKRRNRGKMVDEYTTAANGRLGDEWCAAFVSWVMGKADSESQHTLNLHRLEGLAQPQDFEKIAQKLGVLRQAGDYVPKRGDLLVFRWSLSGDYHLEIVTEPPEHGLIKTIGGNAEIKPGEPEGVRKSAYHVRENGKIGFKASDVIGIVDIRTLLMSDLSAKKGVQQR